MTTEQLWTDSRIIDEITNHPKGFAAAVTMRNEYEGRLDTESRRMKQRFWDIAERDLRIEALETELARLRGELAAARQWQPVEDGERVELHGSGAMGIPTPSALMATPNNGLRILMQKTDMNGTSGVWYQSRLNDEHAVCRLVPPAAGGEVTP